MKRIAYQGLPGSNAENATREFMHRHKLLVGAKEKPVVTSMNVANDVFVNDCDYGVLALKNSLAGIVYESRVALQRFPGFRVLDSVDVEIKHTLAILNEVDLSNIEEVHSHEMALKQCSEFLQRCLPHVARIESKDTAISARHLSIGALKSSAAVICSPKATELYKLKTVVRDISNSTPNLTTFLLIEKASIN